MKKLVLGIVIVLVLALGGYFIINSLNSNITGGTITGSIVSKDLYTTSEVTKIFVLTGENFKFLMDGKEAPELHVKEGDRVRIEFSSTNGFHDWVVGEFSV